MRMYRSLSKNASGSRKNNVISPYSLLSVLTLAMLGTGDITKHQIRDVLSLPCNKESAYYEAYQSTTNSLFKENGGTINISDDQFTLDAANRIYIDKSINLKESYIEKSKSLLNADPDTASFSEDPERARTDINNWVEIKTRNKIQNMLPQNSINRKTKIVLVNALYLNASWSLPFTSVSRKEFYNRGENGVDPLSDTKAPFQSPNGYPTRFYQIAEMMSVVGNFVTGTLPPSFNAKFLLLPYQSKSVRASMVIILPTNSSKSNLDDVENKITKLRNGELSKMIGNARMKQSESKRLTRVEMPKFKIETEENLKPILFELGVKSLFDPMNCNFSGMVTGDSSGLTVDSVLQKAYISTDMHGTEAAAATTTISKTSLLSPASINFIINRPFMFIVRANDINLFLGKVYRV